MRRIAAVGLGRRRRYTKIERSGKIFRRRDRQIIHQRRIIREILSGNRPGTITIVRACGQNSTIRNAGDCNRQTFRTIRVRQRRINIQCDGRVFGTTRRTRQVKRGCIGIRIDLHNKFNWIVVVPAHGQREVHVGVRRRRNREIFKIGYRVATITIQCRPGQGRPIGHAGDRNRIGFARIDIQADRFIFVASCIFDIQRAINFNIKGADIDAAVGRNRRHLNRETAFIILRRRHDQAGYFSGAQRPRAIAVISPFIEN